MPDDEHRTKYSAAQKMQLLKSQQAKLEIRAMPAHSQLKLKAYDKKTKKKRKKKIVKQKSRKVKLSLDAADSSSSSKSKVSLASTGSNAAVPRSASHKSDVQQLSTSKEDEKNALKWRHRTKYIYEAERISIRLKEIAAECEKDIELRVTMDDIVTRIDTLKRARDEYYQYVQAQNDIFDKQIKLLDELQAIQTTELSNKVRRLSEIFTSIDAKLSVIKTKLQNITNQQAQKTLMQNFVEAIWTIF